MAKITPEEIQRIAALAHIGLSVDEIKKHAVELSTIVESFELLNELDVTKTLPTHQVTGLKDVWREDVVGTDKPTRAEMFSNIPKNRVKDGYFVVKRVIE